MRCSLITTLGLAVCAWGCSPGVALAAEPARPLVMGFERFFAMATDEPMPVQGGLLLLEELQCVACHAAPEGWRDLLPGKGKISLEALGRRVSNEVALAAFLREPAKEKPGTLMPDLFDSADEGAIEALLAYLRTRQAGDATKAFPPGRVEEGRHLYHTVGCVACHEPGTVETYRPEEAQPEMEPPRPALPSAPLKLARHYAADALAAFLQDPLTVRHAGRMPATPLSDQEAADLAAFLQADGPPPALSKKSATGEESLRRGHEIFAQKRCAACHETGTEESVVKAAQALVQLRPGEGCLSATPSPGLPWFSLSPEQKRALEAGIAHLKKTPRPQAMTAEQQADHFMVKMNCYACHEWRGKGGLEKARAQYFTVHEAAAHSLGELGMLPPKLDAAGRKLTRAWMERLLWGKGGGVRPYMTARMPAFGKENAAGFVEPFAEACLGAEKVEIDTSGRLGHQRAERGRVLLGVGEGGLGCISCHGLKDRKSLGVPVVNLTHTVERLQPEYFKELLLNPQAVQPGTLMPPLFIGRKRADLEIESLWTYFRELDQSRLPEGLLQEEDYELKPEAAGKPMVFRTFLDGAGMHAVAVGFPQRLHVAFDALEVRWALAWKGRFVDAMTTWEERAMTPAKPLGDAVRSLPARMPLARLVRTGDAWPETFGTAAGYRFGGYRLRADGVPVFLYEVDNLRVEDSIEPAPQGLKRLVKITGHGENWHFLGLRDGGKPKPLHWKSGQAVFEELLAW